ncbi:hypothetical protein NQZ68_038149 [Dissostichus eleginoides]|nr:hypothetical protein NQZ68_038149 [Dissostichus eleginoides]
MYLNFHTLQYPQKDKASLPCESIADVKVTMMEQNRNTLWPMPSEGLSWKEAHIKLSWVFKFGSGSWQIWHRPEGMLRRLAGPEKRRLGGSDGD